MQTQVIFRLNPLKCDAMSLGHWLPTFRRKRTAFIYDDQAVQKNVGFKYEDTLVLQNFENYWSSNTALHPRRLHCTTTPLWDTETSQQVFPQATRRCTFFSVRLKANSVYQLDEFHGLLLPRLDSTALSCSFRLLPSRSACLHPSVPAARTVTRALTEANRRYSRHEMRHVTCVAADAEVVKTRHGLSCWAYRAVNHAPADFLLGKRDSQQLLNTRLWPTEKHLLTLRIEVFI
jgi:hypothetical protein